MKIKNIFYTIVLLTSMVGCVDLDIPPRNILTNEDIYNEGGITAYMAALYARLPMEDFNMTDGGNHNGFFFWDNIKWDMLSTGETVNRNNPGIYIPQKGYWSNGYKIIRQANALIKDLPEYLEQFPDAPKWIAEAKFIRAYTYFAMVKRYGGMPLVDEPQTLTNNDENLWVARSSHEASIDFILKDLDEAIENLGEENVSGRANKYVAAAFKSRVALYAGSVARYGSQYDYISENGVQLCGIPSVRANDYFKQAFDAALIVEKGGYKLYDADPDKAVNFHNIFANADDSPESIFVRQYDLNNNVHSFDAVYCPPRMTTTYGDRYNVTLDWVELFEGLPIDETTGRLKTTENGKYIVYDNERELFKNAEPRLRGSILLPGETYKGVTLDIRSGLIKENIAPDTPIDKFIPDDGQTTKPWSGVEWFKNNVLTTTEDVKKQNPYVNNVGTKININGLDGPANGGSHSTLTGFHGSKWLDLDMTVSETQLNRSTSTWIDIRYAEVLLNRAEAAIEIAQSGETSYSEINLFDDAAKCINDIRKRAGATANVTAGDLMDNTPMINERGTGFCSFVFAPNKGLHVVRVERYKELAFEHKIYWDLRRWFTFHEQIDQYRRRMLAPFMFAKDATLDSNTGNPIGKYIYETRVCERASGSITFANKNYYDKIPDSERKINPLLEQNNQY